GVVGGRWYVKKMHAKEETLLANDAAKALEGKQYAQAARLYDDAAKRFERSSKDLPKYKSLKGFSEAADAATSLTEPADKRREKLTKYVNDTESQQDTLKPMLDERRDELYEIMLKIAQDQATDAEQKQA